MYLHANVINPWILVSTVICFGQSTVWGLYSPISEVDVAVPAGIPPTEPLLVVRTLPEGPASYVLATERRDWISLDRTSGELRLANYKALNSLAGHTPTGRKVSLGVTSREGEHLMLVNITPVAAAKCSRMRAEELCFWKAVKYQVYENQPATVLGPLGPQFVRRICPGHYVISYNITNGTEYASLAEDGVSLQTREGLDRDTRPDESGVQGPGHEFFVTVTCMLDRGLSTEEVTTTVPVTVLDEDDNPPVAQDNPIHVSHNGSKLKEWDSGV